MAEDTTEAYDRESYTLELDRVSAAGNTMPDDWMGYARLALEDEGLSLRQKAKVLKHTRNIVEDKSYPAEKTAEKVLDKLGF